jgi:hypothetical protein
MKTAFLALTAMALAPFASATDIEISYSPEFQEKLQDDYGIKEGDKLKDDIRSDLERELGKANLDPARVAVTIVDAKPNRPTMEQMGRRPGLDMLRSKSLGGMELAGVAYDASGTPVGQLQYDWFENDITHVVASGVWSDASRASRRFAQKFAEELSDPES